MCLSFVHYRWWNIARHMGNIYFFIFFCDSSFHWILYRKRGILNGTINATIKSQSHQQQQQTKELWLRKPISLIFSLYTISQCSVVKAYHRPADQQPVDGDDNAPIVNTDEQNASNIVPDDTDDSNELKNNADVPMNMCCDSNDSSNNNNSPNDSHAHANENSEIDGETMDPLLLSTSPTSSSSQPNVSISFRRPITLCNAPSTSDGNDNPKWRRRLRTPVWARSLTLYTLLISRICKNLIKSYVGISFAQKNNISTKHSSEIGCTPTHHSVILF